MTTTTEVAEQGQYLTFMLAGEEYALGILRVKEIIEYDVLTTLPSVPPHVRGVINLRGSVVPVIDLSLRFGLPERPVTKRTCIIIVEIDHQGDRVVMGVIADAVSQVIDLRRDEVEPAPAFGTSVRTDHLVGMGKVGKKFILILDVDRVLSPGDMASAATEARPAAGEAA